MTRPLISNHGSETILLGLMGVGVVALLALAIWREKLDGLDVAAFLLVLVRIVEAVQKRWEQRSSDLATARLHASKPDPEAAGMQSLPHDDEGEQ